MTPEQKAELVTILTDIAERAEFECEVAKRAGNKQGNYREIARQARKALRVLQS